MFEITVLWYSKNVGFPWLFLDIGWWPSGGLTYLFFAFLLLQSFILIGYKASWDNRTSLKQAVLRKKY